MFNQQPLPIDLLTSGWVVVVFAIGFGLIPLIAFPQTSIPSIASRMVGGFVRITIAIVIGGIL